MPIPRSDTVGGVNDELDQLDGVYGVWGRLPSLYAAQDCFTFLGRPRKIRAEAVAALRLRPGATVLEIGCGTGRNFTWLERGIGPHGRLVGVDYSASMLGAAGRLAARRHWSNVSLVRGDAAQLPVRAGTADAVLAVLSMSVIPDHVAALRRCHDALRPNGVLVVCDARPFPGRLRHINSMLRVVYGELAGWRPDRDLAADIRRVFGNVTVQENNRGSFFVAAARRAQSCASQPLPRLNSSADRVTGPC